MMNVDNQQHHGPYLQPDETDVRDEFAVVEQLLVSDDMRGLTTLLAEDPSLLLSNQRAFTDPASEEEMRARNVIVRLFDAGKTDAIQAILAADKPRSQLHNVAHLLRYMLGATENSRAQDTALAVLKHQERHPEATPPAEPDAAAATATAPLSHDQTLRLRQLLERVRNRNDMPSSVAFLLKAFPDAWDDATRISCLSEHLESILAEAAVGEGASENVPQDTMNQLGALIASITAAKQISVSNVGNAARKLLELVQGAIGVGPTEDDQFLQAARKIFNSWEIAKTVVSDMERAVQTEVDRKMAGIPQNENEDEDEDEDEESLNTLIRNRDDARTECIQVSQALLQDVDDKRISKLMEANEAALAAAILTNNGLFGIDGLPSKFYTKDTAQTLIEQLRGRHAPQLEGLVLPLLNDPSDRQVIKDGWDRVVSFFSESLHEWNERNVESSSIPRLHERWEKLQESACALSLSWDDDISSLHTASEAVADLRQQFAETRELAVRIKATFREADASLPSLHLVLLTIGLVKTLSHKKRELESLALNRALLEKFLQSALAAHEASVGVRERLQETLDRLHIAADAETTNTEESHENIRVLKRLISRSQNPQKIQMLMQDLRQEERRLEQLLQAKAEMISFAPHVDFLPEIKLELSRFLTNAEGRILDIPRAYFQDFECKRGLADRERHTVTFVRNAHGEALVLKSYEWRDGRVPESFYVEAEMLNKMKHKNIVPLQSIVLNAQRPCEMYLCMPYYPLRNLNLVWENRFRENRGTRAEAFAVNTQDVFRSYIHIVAGVLDGLTYLHSYGVVHSNIRPTNILMQHVFEAGTKTLATVPVIADFDIAFVPGHMAASAPNALRKPSAVNYASPELLRDPQHPKPRCDVYALGVTMVWMLFGEAALAGKSTPADVQGLLRTFNGFGELGADLDAHVITFGLELLRDNVEERITAAQARNSGFFASVAQQHVPELTQTQSASASSECPIYWTRVQDRNTSAQLVDVTEIEKEWVEAVMNETSTWDNVGEGKDAVNQPRFSRFEVVTVERLENADLMFEYKARQGTIIKEMAEDNVQRRMEKLPRTETVELFRTNAAGQRVRLEYGNISALQRLDAAEFLLFHGTKRDRTREIITSGLDNRFTGDGAFGNGAYFSENASKADQYSDRTGDTFKMVIARVTLGEVGYVNETRFGANHPPTIKKRPVPEGGRKRYHSTVANTRNEDPRAALSKHREFVVYERPQSYPELIVTYKRVGDSSSSLVSREGKLASSQGSILPSLSLSTTTSPIAPFSSCDDDADVESDTAEYEDEDDEVLSDDEPPFSPIQRDRKVEVSFRQRARNFERGAGFDEAEDRRELINASVSEDESQSTPSIDDEASGHEDEGEIEDNGTSGGDIEECGDDSDEDQAEKDDGDSDTDCAGRRSRRRRRR